MSIALMRLVLAGLLCLAALSLTACSQEYAPYPGGRLASATPELLAPGIINTGLPTRDLTLSPDGRELYFCQATAGYGQGAILVTRQVDGQWTAPEVASFSGHRGWVDLEPCLSPDGHQLFFYSSRPDADGQEAQDIWVADRVGQQWGTPRNLGAPVNTPAAEYFPSVTADGTLYFCRADPQTRIHSQFRARRVDGRYLEPERLPAAVNSGRNRFNAWVAPDEDRLIISVAGHPDNLGGVDYWLALRDSTDQWRGPLNLGPLVNDGSRGGWSPYVSPDGESFFFMSTRLSGPAAAWPETWSSLQDRHRRPGAGRPGIHWMRAAFLDSLAAGRPMPAETLTSTGTAPSGAGFSGTFPSLRGPYLGQQPPGLTPEIFAPDLVSTGLTERDIHISADGRVIRYGLMDLGLVTTLETRLEGGGWSEPATVGYHLDRDAACFEPTFSADGQTVYFLANRAAPGQTQGRGWANQNIFRSHFRQGVWTPPEALPAPVTTEQAEYYPSLTTGGVLYFSREDTAGHPAIWCAEPLGDGFADPVRLPPAVNCGPDNYNAFVAPDESFLLLCVGGHPENLGRADYWISYRGADGAWQPAQNLGPLFNGPETRASSAFLSPDRQVLFFSATRPAPGAEDLPGRYNRADLTRMHSAPGFGSSDVWWVAAAALPEPRP